MVRAKRSKLKPGKQSKGELLHSPVSNMNILQGSEFQIQKVFDIALYCLARY